LSAWPDFPARMMTAMKFPPSFVGGECQGGGIGDASILAGVLNKLDAARPAVTVKATPLLATPPRIQQHSRLFAPLERAPRCSRCSNWSASQPYPLNVIGWCPGSN